MSTWLEDVQTALKNLGGEAHLSKIFEEVKRVRKNLNPSWTRTVQKELERHSSDSSVWNSKYKGKEDLFYSAKGIGEGVWGLRKMFAVAPTDLDWFQQLRTEGVKGEVINFWTPTPWNISRLQADDKLYFMLKSPIRKIGGFGKFVDYKNMRASEAWRKYGRDNGVENLSQLISRTDKYKAKHTKKNLIADPVIGCILLKDPEFYDNENLKTDKSEGIDFPKQVVKIKYFRKKEKTAHEEKEREIKVSKAFELVDSSKSKKKQLTQKERKGQAAFRRDILKIYDNSCSITEIKQKEVLEAAHIQGYINEESNNVQNGICLRVDIHKLFDNGLISINSDYRVVVSSMLKSTEY
jgi:putative restriction endonuclease